jgi:Mor family transcriptional regulator
MAKHVEEIRVGYQESQDKQHYVSNAAKQYDCSSTTIRDILKRKTYPQIRPDLPAVDFSKVGNLKFPDCTIQAIRATCDANPTVQGLKAALARHFGCNETHVYQISIRLMRPGVPDDPSAAIPLDQLPFKALTQHGSDHPLSKVTTERVLEILRALKAGVRVVVLALKYKISIQRIYAIRKGKAYPEAQALFRAEQAGAGEGQS